MKKVISKYIKTLSGVAEITEFEHLTEDQLKNIENTISGYISEYNILGFLDLSEGLGTQGIVFADKCLACININSQTFVIPYDIIKYVNILKISIHKLTN